jgi:hypothetical protein
VAAELEVGDHQLQALAETVVVETVDKIIKTAVPIEVAAVVVEHQV